MGDKPGEKPAVVSVKGGSASDGKAKAGKPAIFIFTTAYDPYIGGAEVAIKEVVQRLKDEFRFFIFTSRFRLDLQKVEEKDGILIRRIGLGFWFDKLIIPFAGFFVVRSYAARYKPHLFWAVMASYASGIPYLINILSLSKPTPIVLTLQEGDSLEHIKNAKFGFVAIAWKSALRRTHHLTAISKFLLSLGKEFGYSGGTDIIPNGVDVSSFTKVFLPDELKILREALGIKASERVVVTTSRLVEKNALDVAVRSMGILKLRGVVVKFVVIGSGDKEKELKTLAHKEGVGDSVIFLGNIPHKDVPKYLKISDVFVRPSRSEGLGNSFIEAMAAGVPIIGTMVGGISDFLKDGETGLAVKVDDPSDLASKIEMLLSDTALKDRVRDGGRRTALVAFQWEDIIQRYATTFQAVLREYAKPAVLVATGVFPPDIGGPATYSKLIFDELPGRGFRVKVLSFGAVRHLPKIIRHMAYFVRIFSAARLVDIVFAQDPVSVGFPAVLAAKILKKKYVLKIVGDYAWEQATQRFGVTDFLDDFLKKSYGVRTGVLRKLQTFTGMRADCIIVPSIYLKGVVMHWGLPGDKIKVVYNAVDIRSATISGEEARRKLGIAGKIAVSAGRLVPWKGFEVLIESVVDIRKNFPNFKLFIIGSGPEETKLKSKIISLDLQDIVLLVGPLPHENLLEYIKAAYVFILNTGYEGFSHTLLEAMAEGTPVITTPAGGNAEIIKNGGNGILVPYNNRGALAEAVKMLFNDYALQKNLAVSSIESASLFSKEKMLDSTSETLRSLVESR